MLNERVCCYHIKNNSIFSLLSVWKIVRKWIASADTKKKFGITHAHTHTWVCMYIVDPHYYIYINIYNIHIHTVDLHYLGCIFRNSPTC